MVMDARFDQFLMDISTCFIEKDLPKWRSRLVLPFTIVTKSAPVILTTDEAVKTNFDLYLQACEVMNLDLIVRHPISLEDCKDGTWLGTYQTRLVSNQILATAPYTSTSLLKLVDGDLKMVSMLNGRGHSEWTGDVLN